MKSKMVRRTIEATKVEVDKPKRQVLAIVNDDSVDRFNTVLNPLGIDTKPFMAAGGPIIFEHGKSEHGMHQIGNAKEIHTDRYQGRNVLMARIRFWEGDALAETLWRRYANQEMKSWSINLRATEASPPSASEIRSRPDLEHCSVIYRSGELLETSAVSVGGCAGALTVSVERGLQSDPTTRKLIANIRADLARMSEEGQRRFLRDVWPVMRARLLAASYGPTPGERKFAEHHRRVAELGWGRR